MTMHDSKYDWYAWNDPDEDFQEDPEMLEAFDPELFADAAEMADEFGVFGDDEDSGRDFTLLADEEISMDLTDQIDWDAIDYE